MLIFSPVIIFIKLCKASCQVWVKGHPTLFFLISPSWPGLAHQPVPRHGDKSALQGVVAYGQCRHWAGACQARAGCWVCEDCHLCSGTYSDLRGTGRSETKRSSACLSGKTANQSWRKSLVSDKWKSWREKLQKANSFIGNTQNVRLKVRKILVAFWDLKTVRTLGWSYSSLPKDCHSGSFIWEIVRTDFMSQGLLDPGEESEEKQTWPLPSGI